MENGSGHFTIAFDPSYISKSGKSTPGVTYFGLELQQKLNGA